MLTFASDSAMNLHIDNGILRQVRRKSNESAEERVHTHGRAVPAAGCGSGDEARLISFAPFVAGRRNPITRLSKRHARVVMWTWPQWMSQFRLI
jgi:hypothetical protein